MPVIQSFYKFFRFEAKSSKNMPLPQLPLGCQQSIRIGSRMTARDLGLTKCFMSDPISKKKDKFVFRSTLSPHVSMMKEAGVLLSYRELCFIEDTENRRQFLTMKLMLPMLNYTVNSCTNRKLPKMNVAMKIAMTPSHISLSLTVEYPNM